MRSVRVVEYLASGLAILGAVLNAAGSISGFYVWLISNSLWIYFGWRRRIFGLMAMQAVFLVLAAIGIVCWTIQEKGIRG